MLKRTNSGITLVEVMVTLLIVGVGLLGLLGLQAKSLAGHKDSMDRKAAAELVSQIGERMRANHLGFMRDDYTTAVKPNDATPTAPNCGVATPCSVAELAQLDISLWLQTLRKRLPDSGAYIVTSGGAGAKMDTDGTSVRVTVVWREAQEQSFTDDACSTVGLTDKFYRCLAAEIFP